jgi:CRP-like cAMP-binding protein
VQVFSSQIEVGHPPSVLVVQPDGRSVEVGLIGREGLVGVPVVFGLNTSALWVVAQAEATAHRVEVGALKTLMTECPKLRQQLQVFAMIFAMQCTQIAACNRLH